MHSFFLTGEHSSSDRTMRTLAALAMSLTIAMPKLVKSTMMMLLLGVLQLSIMSTMMLVILSRPTLMATMTTIVTG